jgi:hypothetical protein
MIAALLSVLPESEHDRLIALLADGPAMYEKLSGRRPHRSLVWRHAKRGVAGVTLKTVSVGGTLMTTARWIVEHWEAVDAARRAPKRKRRAS